MIFLELTWDAFRDKKSGRLGSCECSSDSNPVIRVYWISLTLLIFRFNFNEFIVRIFSWYFFLELVQGLTMLMGSATFVELKWINSSVDQFNCMCSKKGSFGADSYDMGRLITSYKMAQLYSARPLLRVPLFDSICLCRRWKMRREMLKCRLDFKYSIQKFIYTLYGWVKCVLLLLREHFHWSVIYSIVLAIVLLTSLSLLWMCAFEQSYFGDVVIGPHYSLLFDPQSIVERLFLVIFFCWIGIQIYFKIALIEGFRYLL